MNLKFLTLLALALIVATAAPAQTALSSIDGVYIERYSADLKKNMFTVIYDLQDKTILNDDVIAFDIPGFGDFLVENNISLSDVVLLIEQIPLREIPAYVENMEAGVVRFKFSEKHISSANRQQLYNLRNGPVKELQLGVKAGETTLTYGQRAKIYFANVRYWSILGWVLIVAFLVFFWLLLTKFKTMIKDNVAQLTDDPKKVDPSFSFGRTQLAFWTFIIISSFIYLWAYTGDLNSINSTALILLGITSGTITATNLISAREESLAVSKNKQKDLLDNRLSDGFWKDILSDKGGISIHRFQALVFNIIFGIVFFKSVIADYAMPSFDETQLILLGLSNGTYAFMKNSENLAA